MNLISILLTLLITKAFIYKLSDFLCIFNKSDEGQVVPKSTLPNFETKCCLFPKAAIFYKLLDMFGSPIALSCNFNYGEYIKCLVESKIDYKEFNVDITCNNYEMLKLHAVGDICAEDIDFLCHKVKRDIQISENNETNLFRWLFFSINNINDAQRNG